MYQRHLFVIITLPVLLIFYSCSGPKKFYYKNNDYYAKKLKGKKLYIDDVDRVMLDDTAKAFTLYSLKMDSRQLEDTLTAVLNSIVKELAMKHLKKFSVVTSGGKSSDSEIRADSSVRRTVTITDKHSVSKEFYIPDKTAYKDPAIRNINYLFKINSPIIRLSNYFIPIFVPLPGGFVSGSTSGPCFVLKGTYVMWDYDKDRAICAGEFSKTIMSMKHLLKRKVVIDIFKPMVGKIYVKTPYPVYIEESQ